MPARDLYSLVGTACVTTLTRIILGGVSLSKSCSDWKTSWAPAPPDNEDSMGREDLGGSLMLEAGVEARSLLKKLLFDGEQGIRLGTRFRSSCHF